jgi:hypothetical protein
MSCRDHQGLTSRSYWVVRVKERAVEVLREPDPIARTYRSRVTMSEAATLTPKAFAGPTISLLALFG